MHPSLSIIAFTASSGAGYGLLALAGLLAPFGWLPGDRGFGAAVLGLALGLVSAGLIASLWHLGRPGRAWRAVSQWRSSWLSREGLAALLTYVPALLFALGWVGLGQAGGFAAAGLLAAAGAVATVFCTAMIYASLKPIRQWRSAWVPAVYLALAALSGAVLLAALLALRGRTGLAPLVIGLAVLAGLLKEAHWRAIRRGVAQSTPETATGLGPLGRVRLFEAPHTEENYLLREMGFRIARRHARRLRRIVRAAAFGAPIVLGAFAWAAGGRIALAALLLAIPAVALGVLAERWLFFAEAKHTVTLYYGADRV